MHATMAHRTRELVDNADSAPLHVPPFRVAVALRRAQQLAAFAAVALRVVLLLPMLIALCGTAPGHLAAALPLGVSVLTIIGVRRGWWSGDRVAAIDAVSYAFFVSLTGGLASPFVVGCVLLIPIAALHDGVRGSVTAACFNLIAVLMAAVVQLPAIAPQLPTVLLSVFGAGVASSWTAAMADRIVQYLCTGVQRVPMPAPASAPVSEQVLGDIEQLVRITDPQQQLRAAKQVARTIAGCIVDIQVGTLRLTGVGDAATRLVCDAAGTVAVLTVHRPPASLSAGVLAQLRVIGHVVARNGELPVEVVDARDVTVDTALLAGTAPTMSALTVAADGTITPVAASSWESLDIPGLVTEEEELLETAVPTTPLAQAVVTAVLPESTPKRRNRATSDSAQLNLWI